MLNDSAEEGGGTQYKLTVTSGHKHDSSDFPEDCAQPVATYVRRRPHELVIAGETASFPNAHSVWRSHLCLGSGNKSGLTRFFASVFREINGSRRSQPRVCVLCLVTMFSNINHYLFSMWLIRLNMLSRVGDLDPRCRHGNTKARREGSELGSGFELVASGQALARAASP